MRAVSQPVRKKDAMALVTGKPVFTDDIAPKDCLVVKVLRSPHANAMVKNIRTDLAEKVELYGIHRALGKLLLQRFPTVWCVITMQKRK